MRLIKRNTRIDFIGKRGIAAIISALAILVSVGSLAVQQLQFGIDFTGGVVIETHYPNDVSLNKVRSALAKAGYKDAVVQNFGTLQDVQIRLSPRKGADTSDVSDRVLKALQADDAGVQMRRVEFVGPQVGEELANKGGLALLYAIIGILIYVIVRFHWKLSVGAVVALVHDVVITLGVFSLFRLDFDLTVLAAVLAVLGYSINDTIVVFDRIRENFRRMRKAEPAEVVNGAINQTLARTLMTALTTMLTLAALFLLGGEVIHGFATALLIGVGVGTYSSIFIASALALWFGVNKEDLFPPKEEDADKHARLR